MSITIGEPDGTPPWEFPSPETDDKVIIQ